jgi:hypothetical protein
VRPSPVALAVFLSCWFSASCFAAHHNDENNKSIVVRWNQVVLKAVRTSTQLGPPVIARALAVVHTCIYDAWAAYDGTANGTEYGNRLRRPLSERTEANKQAAISYAAYRAASDLFPDSGEIYHFMADDLGYDPGDESADTSTAAGVGNIACNAVLTERHRDGSNQLGDMTENGTPYWDYTDYSPVNGISRVPMNTKSVIDPNRFQPIYYASAGVRVTFPQPFLGAQWFKVHSFAGPYSSEIAAVASAIPLAKYGSPEYESQARELVDISSALTDEQKMISEYWTDGPDSELPAGHWCLFAQFVSTRDHHTLDEDAKLFFVLTNAVFDAGIAAWEAKREFDSVRPITAIPYIFKGEAIRSWGGPGKATVTMDASEWMPYQPLYFPSPPFPEYPSGHSAFSSAAATILERWTGSQQFGDSVSFAPRSSRIERGITPVSEITLQWPTFRIAADQAGLSRRYGGLHFRSGDLAGRKLGRLVAERVWQKTTALFGGG